jgi:DNA-binding MarR family transcriptional regulator
MTKAEKALEQFGLNKNETKVYLEILNHDESSPFQISKLTGIPRTTVYDIVMTLSLKGLIELKQSDGFTKQQTLIRAKNPSVLRKILQDKRKELTKLELNILDILPDLKQDFHKEESNAYIKFSPGIENVKKMLLDFNTVDLPTYVFTDEMPADAVGNSYTDEAVQEELKATKHKLNRLKKIIPLNDWTKHVIGYQYSLNPDYIKFYETRFIDNPIFDLNQEIYIQGDLIWIITAKDDEIWAATITSKLLAKSLISIHQLIWNMATPLTDGIVKSWGKDEYAEVLKEN